MLGFSSTSDDSHITSWRRIGLGFVLIYLLALLLWVPANLVLGWLQPRLAAQGLRVELPVAEGSLWQGRFSVAESLFGLRQLGWQVAPAALLQGRLGVDLQLGDQVIVGRAGLGLDHSLSLDEVRINGRVSELLASLNGVPLLSDAKLQGVIEGLVWSREGCEALEQGQVLIDDWSGFAAQRLNLLGGVQIVFSCKEQQLLAQIGVGESRLQLQGELSLSPTQNYRLSLSAKPQSTELREMLLDLGFAHQGGSLVLRRNGRLR